MMVKIKGFIKYCLIFVFFFSVLGTKAQKNKINHGPYLQNLTNNSVDISWSTLKDCIAWVEFYEEDGSNFYLEERVKKYHSKGGIKVIGKLHSVSLKNLKPDTKYAYRIYSQEVTEDGYLGKAIATRVYKREPLYFSTLSQDKQEVSCVVLSDMHEDADKVGKLLDGVKWDVTDFVLLNGDFISDFYKEQDLYSVIDTCVDVFAKETPLYIVRGNHETRGTKAHLLGNYFSFPDGEYYYTFKMGSTLFIVLDSGEDKTDSDIAYRGLVDYDDYRSEQAEWLKRLMKTESFKNAKNKVVFMHIPPYVSASKYDWHGNKEVRKKFVPILNEADVDVMICGHTHTYAFIEETAGRNSFPIVIMDNKSRLNLQANEDGVEVNIFNMNSGANPEHSFKFKK